LKGAKPLFKIIKGCGNCPGSGFDGAADNKVAGTYLHGIFHNFQFRRYFTDYLRRENDMEELGYEKDDFEDLKRFSIDRLAAIFEDNIQMNFIDGLIEI
jgi:adenosylcobyric acid synthase